MKVYNMGTAIFTIKKEPIDFKATEAELRKIYDAAFKGLRGDSMAIKVGYMPSAFTALREIDPLVNYAIMRGQADFEEAISDGMLTNAINNNDAKMQIHLSTHRMGYMPAKPAEGERQDIRIVVENSLPDPKLPISTSTAINGVDG